MEIFLYTAGAATLVTGFLFISTALQIRAKRKRLEIVYASERKMLMNRGVTFFCTLAAVLISAAVTVIS